MLGIRFDFPRHGSRQKISNLPELALVALIIIAVKIYYPFDSFVRHARSQLDVGVLNIDWRKWCELQEQHDRRPTSNGEIGRGNEILVHDQDILTMSNEQLDEYLGWYQKTWIDENDDKNDKKGLPKQLLDMFPTSRINSSSATTADFSTETKLEQSLLHEKLRTAQSTLQLRPKISAAREGKVKETPRRSGSFYECYHTIEDLPPQAKAFHEAAASTVEVSLSTLLTAVRQIEVKLQVWRVEHIKEMKGESEADDSASEQESTGTSDAQATSSDAMEVD